MRARLEGIRSVLGAKLPSLPDLAERLARQAFGWIERREAERRAERERRFEERRARLIKDRPLPLEARYHLLEEEAEVDEAFARLRRHVFAAIDVLSRAQPRGFVWFKEHGKIAPDRLYFYVKPGGRPGWLFERSPSGWVVARSEKIVDRNLFLREGELLDRVLLYKGHSGHPRATSREFGELLPFLVYEQRVLDWLGLGDSFGERSGA